MRHRFAKEFCVLDDPAGSARDAERARSIFDTEYNLPANAVRLAGALEAAKRAALKRAKPRAHPCYSCANGLVS
jgi:hypothetical protein